MSASELLAEAEAANVGRDGAWPRMMASIYDPFLRLGERAGMRARRGALLAEARGRVLEIGAGTGLNLDHYTGAVEELVLTDPEEPMARRLEARLSRRAHAGRVLRAEAEALPLPDASVDSVVSTLVLCTVRDPVRALNEIGRVLRPDGRLLFIEHVRSDRRWAARLQDACKEPWRRFAGNCHCNRPTVRLLEERGFRIERLQTGAWRRMPPVVRPLVAGSARPPAAERT